MKDQNAIRLLIQELENDYMYIKEGAALRVKAVYRADASGWSDELDLMVVGGSLHSLYSAFEAYFLRVAKFFENNVDQQSWHRDILDRMTLDITDLRPALIDDPVVVERIDELRRFRHLFRNLYKTKLKAVKLKIVNDAAVGIEEDFLSMHVRFVKWLDALAAALGNE